MPQLFGVAGRPNGWRAAKMSHRKRSLILLCLPPRCWSFSLGQKHVWVTNTSSDGCRASLCLASNFGVVVCADPFADFCDWFFMTNQMTSCFHVVRGLSCFTRAFAFFSVLGQSTGCWLPIRLESRLLPFFICFGVDFPTVNNLNLGLPSDP